MQSWTCWLPLQGVLAEHRWQETPQGAGEELLLWLQGGGVPLGSAPHLSLPAYQYHRGIHLLCWSRNSHTVLLPALNALSWPCYPLRDARATALGSISEVTMQLKKVTALSSPSPALRGAMKNLKLLSELAQSQEQLAADGDGKLVPAGTRDAAQLVPVGTRDAGLEPRASPAVSSAGHPSLVPMAKPLPTHRTSTRDPHGQREALSSSQGNGKQTRRPHWRRPPSHTPAAQLHLLPSRLVFTACPLAAR